MARESVHCIGNSAASPDEVWCAVADFGVGWHPFVAWCEVEVSPRGEVVRRFGAEGDEAVMIERLTYISHSDRVMSYTLVDGIEGAQRYTARLKITANGTGSTITWHADVDGASPRAGEIAAGTNAVFDAGIAALNAPIARVVKRTMPLICKTEPSVIEGTPRLALTVAPEGFSTAKTICILLHGIGGSRKNWDDQLTALGNQMPMVALDLRGYGDSTLGFSQTQIDDYFEDILVVMRQFGAEKLVLCGLSYGSWIAASFALRHPDLITGLVLAGGCTGMSEADPDEREAFRVSREVPLDAGQTPADFADAVVAVIAGPNASARARQALQASMAAIPQDTYRDALNCFCNPPEKLNFGAANFPVLLMTGEHDKLAPPTEIRAVSQRFADAGAPFVGFEVIADAGHVCNLEQPEAVNAHLAQFFGMVLPPVKPATKEVKRSEKRARILNAALREFSKSGYSGASMTAIAKRAEVSKPTLYQYIGQKDALFRAVLDAGRATILAPFDDAVGKEMVGVLWDFSWAYSDFVLHPDNLSIARLMIGEAERVPDIARQYHETGPAQALAGIARYLGEKRADKALVFENADLAAENLWSLILSGPRNHALHFPHDLPNEADLNLSIQNGLRAFLRAYSADVENDLLALQAVGAKRARPRAD